MNYRDAEKYFEKALCASASLWLQNNICHGGTENTETCLKISASSVVLTFRIGSNALSVIQNQTG
jgi:predicted alpha/beta superfamily hydrolase